MAKGKAPKMKVEIIDRKKGVIETKDVSMELHHKDIPQRVGGDGVHGKNNLDALTPWEHEAVDLLRHTGSILVKIVNGVDKWHP